MSPDVPDLLASGLLDRDWVGAQLGTVFASDEDAAARCLEPEADCSPHPLYEPTWSGTSPHPLVDVARIVAEHPDAARHPHGPLAWWVASARADSPVPVPEGVPEIAWGRLRGAALEAAERRAETDDVRVAQRRTKQPPSAQPAPPALPAPGDEPLVTVVLAVSDDGPRLRAVVDTVQAQSYGGWELVVVDDGSADDTTAVLAGIATFEPRVVPMSVPRGGPARARNAALGPRAGQVRRVRRPRPHLAPRLPGGDARPPGGGRAPRWRMPRCGCRDATTSRTGPSTAAATTCSRTSTSTWPRSSPGSRW